MLRINELTKFYGQTCAVNNVSLEVPAGCISILLGPNGAGKSTVIKSIAGLLRYSGRVEISGHENKSVEAKRYLGYVAEFPAMYELLTVREHLEFIARAYKLKDWEDRAERLLEGFQLTDKADKLGSDLSKGMQQKLSIICGVLPQPKVCLFDEPLVGLDPHAIKEFKNLVVQMRDEGCTILISTHMIDSVKEFWDSTYIMMDGKIAYHTTREIAEEMNIDIEKIFFDITEKK
ncbi:MAG TPA: ABC transporter ATP-binding protein [Clostridia bacterium]|jgi:ABC-2 type transport system ATP-binding protein|nr:ABC transporter ATP-binding protein [Clostridiaceae bacterium]HPZ51831.1 ABC transporter ATP-binding protein [Clostridia bacterium]